MIALLSWSGTHRAVAPPKYSTMRTWASTPVGQLLGRGRLRVGERVADPPPLRGGQEERLEPTEVLRALDGEVAGLAGPVSAGQTKPPLRLADPASV